MGHVKRHKYIQATAAMIALGSLVLSACSAPDSDEQRESTSQSAMTGATMASSSTAEDAGQATSSPGQGAGTVPAPAAKPVSVSKCEPADGVTGHVEGAEANDEGGAGGDISTTPEIGTGYRSGMQAVTTENFAVSTANPLATKAACDVLLDGGTAADALVTAQMVLGLVEPQSSGLGGGGYILYYDKESGKTVAVDGREVAPMAATETYLKQVSDDDTSGPLPDARRSGRSIGVPGIVAALEQVHNDYGTRDWADIIAPAADLAREGFKVSPRMAASVANVAEDLAKSPNAAEYFFVDGQPVPAGHTLVNEDYAATLDKIAAQGADALYTGDIAQAIVDEATRSGDDLTPSLLTTADLAGYTPIVRDLLCAPYRDYEVCGMPPSSSGAITVLETLRLLSDKDVAALAPQSADADGALPWPEAVHLISEAERLAYADRDVYIGDPAFVTIPGGVEALLADGYISERSALIKDDESMGEAQPGELAGAVAVGRQQPESGTSHVSIIDGYGNAASMTSSVEAAFGSFHFTNGFILNNQLTDFSAEPLDDAGQPVANRVEPSKRPRSSMSPMLVFSRDDANPQNPNAKGDLAMVLGSPGGSLIIQYVIKTLIGIIDWDLNPQQAVSFPNFGALNRPQTRIGGEHPLLAGDSAQSEELISSLEGLGHEINTDPQTSGLSALVVTDDGIIGGADPRREGVVLGN